MRHMSVHECINAKYMQSLHSVVLYSFRKKGNKWNFFFFDKMLLLFFCYQYTAISTTFFENFYCKKKEELKAERCGVRTFSYWTFHYFSDFCLLWLLCTDIRCRGCRCFFDVWDFLELEVFFEAGVYRLYRFGGGLHRFGKGTEEAI
jgi:hypothetical protein